MPKTLVYAKYDSHAEDIVKIMRQEFGKGNEFCQKITYKTTCVKPEDLIARIDPRRKRTASSPAGQFPVLRRASADGMVNALLR